MTCIIGLVHGDSVFMGADSAGSDGSNIVYRKSPKVFKNGDFGIAYCGSFRMGDILQYKLEIPTQHLTMELDEYMRTLFIDAVIECFRVNGFGKHVSSMYGFDSEFTRGHETDPFLVGVDGRLFTIEEDFQVGENRADYITNGSGHAVAMGSLYTTRHIKNPRQRILTALEATADYITSVAAPFTIIEIKKAGQNK
jgi:20S proteasome alpha/beta subunit